MKYLKIKSVKSSIHNNHILKLKHVNNGCSVLKNNNQPFLDESPFHDHKTNFLANSKKT